MVCSLIEAGHRDALNYGYSFFVDALNENMKLSNLRLKESAFAVRVGYFANQQEWRRFIGRK